MSCFKSDAVGISRLASSCVLTTALSMNGLQTAPNNTDLNWYVTNLLSISLGFETKPQKLCKLPLVGVESYLEKRFFYIVGQRNQIRSETQ